jgi:hypothetical protein
MTHLDDLRADFMRGMTMARDPQNAGIHDSYTPRTTSMYSPWYRNVCRVCRHTFRENDLVLPHPTLPGRMLLLEPVPGTPGGGSASTGIIFPQKVQKVRFNLRVSRHNSRTKIRVNQ